MSCGQRLTEQFWKRCDAVDEGICVVPAKASEWQKEQINLRVGDIVLVKDETFLPRNHWSVAIIVDVFPDKIDGLVRSVMIRMAHNRHEFVRPIQKLVLLLHSDD